MTSLNPIERNPLCRQGYTCIIVCISQNCTISNPFICANCITQPCYIDHKNCRKQLWQTFIQRLINHRPKSQGFKQLEACILKLTATLTRMVEESKISFNKWLRQYYYNYDVVKILNAINDGIFDNLTGNEMFYIYRSSLVPIKQEYKFNKYYHKKAETIVSFMKALQENIISLYDQRVNASDLSSFSFSMESEADITFDIEKNRIIPEMKKPIVSKKEKYKLYDPNDAKQINWNTLHLERQINLEAKLLEQNQFSKIARVDFQNTKVLKLSNNEIGTIEWMRGLVMHSLTQLCLDYNRIDDISPLENLFFPNLKGLHLQYNQIKDIAPMAKLHTPYLQILNLNYNQIESIQALEKCRFQELRRLYLHDNKIKSAMPLLRIKHWNNLQFISLEMNNLPYNNDDFRKLIYTIRGQYMNLTIRIQSSQLQQD